MTDTKRMEQAVIAALLIRPASLVELAGKLKPDMFSDPDLQFVYRAALSLYEKGVRVDMVMLEQEMQKLDFNAYARLNGISFLNDVLLEVRTDANMDTYADEIVKGAALRRLALSLQEIQAAAIQPDAEVEEVVGRLDDLSTRIRNGMASTEAIELAGEVAGRVLEESYAEQEAREQGHSAQILSGVSELDDLTGGFRKGELTVLAARPSMGKTAVALWMALQAARQGKHVVYFSLEMSKKELVARLLSILSGVDTTHLRFKGTSKEERTRLTNAREELKRLPFRVVYCGSDTIDEIRFKSLILKKQGWVQVEYLDYINLCNIVMKKQGLQQTMDLALGDVVRKLKLLAEEMEIPVIVLAQLNRNNENREGNHFPVLSDLRSSGVIEQVADVVLFVYRPEKYKIYQDPKTKEDLRGVGMLFLAKNRNGATGIARFRYNPSLTCLTDYDRRIL